MQVDTSPPQPILLLPHQVSHGHYLLSILQSVHPIAMDTSPTGAGKTHVALWLAQSLGLFPVVIAPKSACTVWTKVCKDHNIPHTCMTYAAIRGIPNKPLTHEWLGRTTEVGTDGKTYRGFVPTPAWTTKVFEGVLLVIDEVHNCKNHLVSQHRACQQLVNTVLENKQRCHSKVLLISATPCDKIEYVQSIMRLQGLIQSKNLVQYNPALRRYTFPGLTEALEACVPKTSSEYTAQVAWLQRYTHYGINPTRALKYCMHIFKEYGQARFTSAMTLPEIEDAQLVIRAGFYQMSDADTELLREGVAALARACQFVPTQQHPSIQSTLVEWGQVTKSLQRIELAKAPTLARLTRAWLHRHNGGQVIVFVHYTATIETLLAALAAHHPKRLDGQTSLSARTKALDGFAHGNCRVIIANLRVGGVGISMHDTLGNRPRLALLVPSYHAIDTHQAAGRVWRVGTKSNATVRLVFGGNVKVEQAILEALAQKSAVMRDMMCGRGQNNDILLPGEYLPVHEPPLHTQREALFGCRLVARHFDNRTNTCIGSRQLLTQLLDYISPCC